MRWLVALAIVTVALLVRRGTSVATIAASKPRALLLSGVYYHTEISLFFAWQLKIIGIDVYFYTKTPPTRGHVTFSRTSAMATVAKDICFFFPATNPSSTNTTLKRPGTNEWVVAIMVTPLVEIAYLEKQGKVSELQVSLGFRPLILVSHHARIEELTLLISFCDRYFFNCTVLHLAKHTHVHALAELQRHNVSRGSVSAMSYAYPVFNVTDVFGITIKKHNVHTVVKNHTMHMVLQGNVESQRRNYTELFHYFHFHLDDRPWSLTILGQGAKQLSVPVELQPHVFLLDQLEYREYYQVIANADLSLSEFVDSNHYDTERASSTVPAAVMTGSPLLLNSKYSTLYPCLDSGIQASWSLNSTTNEEALYKVLHLTKQRAAISFGHDQSIKCFRRWHLENSRLFRQIISLVPSLPSPLVANRTSSLAKFCQPALQFS
jgi:hypothetical protein